MSIIKKDSVVLTAGIGDFISIDSFLTEEERAKIKTVFFATKNVKNIQSLMREVKDFFPNLKDQIVAWNQFDLFHAFGKASWLNQITDPVDGYNEAQDLSISEVFPRIISEQIPFRGTCLLKKMIATIGRFKLPANYVCIAPSTNNTNELRDFSELEMIHTIKWLRETGQIGVVIGWPHIPMPELPDLINLTGRTSITESVEIVKRSSGYIGIDSWMSVIAAQCLPENKIVIKSNNVHLFIYKQIYYAPHANFNFVTREIGMMNPDPVVASFPYKSLDRDSIRWCYLNDMFYNPNIIEKTNNNSFEIYKKLDKSKLNNKLNEYRSNLVAKHCGGSPILDVGIGSGLFIKKHPSMVYGYDISPEAKRWLQKRQKYFNPWQSTNNEIAGYCFWDSLPYLAHPSLLLARIPKKKFVFVSIPILPDFLKMEDLDQLPNWKHFNPSEQLYYWTGRSFMNYMNSLGYELVEVSGIDAKISKREGVYTFVFHHI